MSAGDDDGRARAKEKHLDVADLPIILFTTISRFASQQRRLPIDPSWQSRALSRDAAKLLHSVGW